MLGTANSGLNSSTHKINRKLSINPHSLPHKNKKNKLMFMEDENY